VRRDLAAGHYNRFVSLETDGKRNCKVRDFAKRAKLVFQIFPAGGNTIAGGVSLAGVFTGHIETCCNLKYTCPAFGRHQPYKTGNIFAGIKKTSTFQLRVFFFAPGLLLKAYSSTAFFSSANPCSFVFSILGLALNSHMKKASPILDFNLKSCVTSIPPGVSLNV
jgi:hypothetical protein